MRLFQEKVPFGLKSNAVGLCRLNCRSLPMRTQNARGTLTIICVICQPGQTLTVISKKSGNPQNSQLPERFLQTVKISVWMVFAPSMYTYMYMYMYVYSNTYIYIHTPRFTRSCPLLCCPLAKCFREVITPLKPSPLLAPVSALYTSRGPPNFGIMVRPKCISGMRMKPMRRHTLAGKPAFAWKGPCLMGKGQHGSSTYITTMQANGHALLPIGICKGFCRWLLSSLFTFHMLPGPHADALAMRSFKIHLPFASTALNSTEH